MQRRLGAWIRKLLFVQGIVNLPKTVIIFSGVISWILSMISSLPLWGKFLLFFVFMDLILFGWALIFRERTVKSKALRGLFLEASDLLQEDDMLKTEVSLRAQLRREFDIDSLKYLPLLSLRSSEWVKYRDHIAYHRKRANRQNRPFEESAVLAKYFESIAERLTFSMISEDFRVPADLRSFLDQP